MVKLAASLLLPAGIFTCIFLYAWLTGNGDLHAKISRSSRDAVDGK